MASVYLIELLSVKKPIRDLRPRGIEHQQCGGNCQSLFIEKVKLS